MNECFVTLGAFLVNAKAYQTFAIDAITIRLIVIASRPERKVPLLSIHQVEAMPDERILTRYPTASIRILNAGRYLHANTRQSRHLLLISLA